MTGEIRILIADDHDIIRKGLRAAIAAEPHWKIIAEAEDRATALEIIEQCQPEIALLDLHMPEFSGDKQTRPVGFNLARIIQQRKLPTRVIFLTYDQQGEVLEAAFNLGVKGYVLKNHAEGEIVRAIAAVAAGGTFISPRLHHQAHRRSHRASAFITEHPGLRDLTRQELNVLKLVWEGRKSEEIGAQLSISFKTVNNHRTTICEKLYLEGPHALAKFVLEYKFELQQFFTEIDTADD